MSQSCAHTLQPHLSICQSLASLLLPPTFLSPPLPCSPSLTRTQLDTSKEKQQKQLSPPTMALLGNRAQLELVNPHLLQKLDRWHFCRCLKAEPPTLGTRKIAAR